MFNCRELEGQVQRRLGSYIKKSVIHMSTVIFIPACAVSSPQPATKFHAATCSLSPSQWDGWRIRKR